MKKEIKKIYINFKNLNKEIDSEQEILCDRLHDLELSHNRKLRLLEKITKHWDPKKTIKLTTKNQIKNHAKEWAKIFTEIKREINAPLRVRSKPIMMKIKKEPLIVPKMDKPFKPKDIIYWRLEK